MEVRMKWHGEEAEAKSREGAVKGLWAGGEYLLGVTRGLVPIEEATLERSGGVDVDESRLVGSVYYDTVYACRQHEELTWRHDPGRQAKYLEQPVVTERDVILALIATQVRRALR